jgi:hypothetical protein
MLDGVPERVFMDGVVRGWWKTGTDVVYFFKACLECTRAQFLGWGDVISCNGSESGHEFVIFDMWRGSSSHYSGE